MKSFMYSQNLFNTDTKRKNKDEEIEEMETISPNQKSGTNYKIY